MIGNGKGRSSSNLQTAGHTQPVSQAQLNIRLFNADAAIYIIFVLKVSVLGSLAMDCASLITAFASNIGSKVHVSKATSLAGASFGHYNSIH